MKETDDLDYIYKSKLDKPCFAHDAACSDSKNLAKAAISSKIMKERPY